MVNKNSNTKRHTFLLTSSASYLATLSLITLTALSFSTLTTSTYADNTNAVDEVTITVPVACTMGGTIITGQEHSTSLQPGTYEANIGKTTLTTYCNDPNGFSIYAIGFTGDQYSGTNHTKLVGNNATNTISTGLTTGSSTTDASSWAMKLTAVTGTYAPTIMNGTSGTENFTNYHVVPDTYTKVATYPSTTDAEGAGSTGSSLETTYAVYVSLSQPADTYTGKVKYTLVHPNAETPEIPLHPETTETGKICYYPNGDNVEGTMGCQDVASSIDLLASNFSRTGYGFAGWNTEYDYTGTFYGPNETISLDTADYTGNNNGLSLYAIWVQSQGSLQDSTKVAQLCGTGEGGLTQSSPNVTPTLNSVSALTDQRDNNTYAIAKLADGKCWMIENLRLESNAAHNGDGSLAQGYGKSTTYGDFSGLANAEASNFTNSTIANSIYYSGTQSGTASINIGTSNNPAWRFPRYNNLNTQSRAQNNPNSNAFPNDGTTGGMYSYGNYYTWHAAIANLTHNSTEGQSVTDTSLCPNGWRLPKGGDKYNEVNNDFWALIVTGINGGVNPADYSRYPYYTGTPEGTNASNALRAYPNNFVYPGNFTTSIAYVRGRSGFYWSSTAIDYNNGAYNLTLTNSDVYPGTYSVIKYVGISVRCMTDS